jgi:hypothetical protein
LLAKVLFFAGDVVGHGAGHGFLSPLAAFEANGFDGAIETSGPVSGTGVVSEVGQQAVA